ncbi:MAG: ComEA family DNA-binding protein [Chloroflexota bacterium]|nr:ComEA family DNA-binding protein [Chloroflexota bacterium]
MRRALIVALPIVAVAGVLGGHLVRARTAPEPAPVAITEEKAPSASPAAFVVDVVGAVARPGLVRLPAGSRILDALLAAGGMTGEADLFALNKATPLRDGQRIYVPRPGEALPAGSAGSDAERKIDINQASLAELETLRGIGPSTAARIVQARGQRPFARTDELQTRGLVPARVFADIKELITTR